MLYTTTRMKIDLEEVSVNVSHIRGTTTMYSFVFLPLFVFLLLVCFALFILHIFLEQRNM
jgi:hypothetical protein